MEKKQEVRDILIGSGFGMEMDKMREEMRGMEHRQHHDLARLRIERNRAARHARCATLRK